MASDTEDDDIEALRSAALATLRKEQPIQQVITRVSGVNRSQQGGPQWSEVPAGLDLPQYPEPPSESNAFPNPPDTMLAAQLIRTPMLPTSVPAGPNLRGVVPGQVFPTLAPTNFLSQQSPAWRGYFRNPMDNRFRSQFMGNRGSVNPRHRSFGDRNRPMYGQGRRPMRGFGMERAMFFIKGRGPSNAPRGSLPLQPLKNASGDPSQAGGNLILIQPHINKNAMQSVPNQVNSNQNNNRTGKPETPIQKTDNSVKSKLLLPQDKYHSTSTATVVQEVKPVAELPTKAKDKFSRYNDSDSEEEDDDEDDDNDWESKKEFKEQEVDILEEIDRLLDDDIGGVVAEEDASEPSYHVEITKLETSDTEFAEREDDDKQDAQSRSSSPVPSEADSLDLDALACGDPVIEELIPIENIDNTVVGVSEEIPDSGGKGEDVGSSDSNVKSEENCDSKIDTDHTILDGTVDSLETKEAGSPSSSSSSNSSSSSSSSDSSDNSDEEGEDLEALLGIENESQCDSTEKLDSDINQNENVPTSLSPGLGNTPIKASPLQHEPERPGSPLDRHLSPKRRSSSPQSSSPLYTHFSPERKSLQPTRGSLSPRRSRDHQISTRGSPFSQRRSLSPRRRPSPRRSSISPFRRHSPLRRSLSPRRITSPLRRNPPHRRHDVPPRRNSPRRSHSPRSGADRDFQRSPASRRQPVSPHRGRDRDNLSSRQPERDRLRRGGLDDPRFRDDARSSARHSSDRAAARDSLRSNGRRDRSLENRRDRSLDARRDRTSEVRCDHSDSRETYRDRGSRHENQRKNDTPPSVRSTSSAASNKSKAQDPDIKLPDIDLESLPPAERAKIEARRRKFGNNEEVKPENAKKTVSLKSIKERKKKKASKSDRSLSPSSEKKQRSQEGENPRSKKQRSQEGETTRSKKQRKRAKDQEEVEEEEEEVQEGSVISESEEEQMIEALSDDEEDSDSGRAWRMRRNDTTRKETILNHRNDFRRKPGPDKLDPRKLSARRAKAGRFHHAPQQYESDDDDDEEETSHRLTSSVISTKALKVDIPPEKLQVQVQVAPKNKKKSKAKPDFSQVYSVPAKRRAGSVGDDDDDDVGTSVTKKKKKKKEKRRKHEGVEEEEDFQVDPNEISPSSDVSVDQSKTTGRPSVLDRLGKKIPIKALEGKDKKKKKKKKSHSDDEEAGELDLRIRRIQEKNTAIARRQREIELDKKKYG